MRIIRPRMPSLLLSLSLLLGSSLVFAEWRPGLLGGFVAAPFDAGGAPSRTNVYLDVHAATNSHAPVWNDLRTWVYWGQIYLDGGPYAFRAEIRGSASLRIGGRTYIRNGRGKDCATDVIRLPAGWHDIEIRLGNGGTGAGSLCGPRGSFCREGFWCGFGLSRGTEPPDSMTGCSYPVDPGDGSLFRHDDGMGFKDAFQVAVEPRGLPCACVPPVGTTGGHAPGERIDCSAPPLVVADGIRYRCVGLARDEAPRGGGAFPASARPVLRNRNEYPYVHGEAPGRVTWFYSPVEVLLDVVVSGGGSVRSLPSGSAVPGEKSPGAFHEIDGSVVLEALPDEGHVFTCWEGTGDGWSDGPRITVMADRPRHLRAVFGRPWTYDPAAKTVTDGEWVLSVQETDGKGLSIAGVKKTGAGGVLDLRTPVLEGGLPGCRFRSIGAGAFQGAAVVRLYLPDELESIGAGAFRRCGDLVSVTPLLPAGLSALGAGAFRDCPRLAGSVRMENRALREVPADLFRGCSGLEGASLPGAERIGGGAFRDCAALEEVSVSPTLRAIGPAAFENCGRLASVAPFLPGTLTNLGGRAFAKCPSLAGDLRLENAALESVGEGAFHECGKIGKAILTGPGDIGGDAFLGCASLESVILSDGLRTLGARAFGKCGRLASVEPFLPPSVTGLGRGVFSGCPSLASGLRLGNHELEEIPPDAFAGCASIPGAVIDGAERIGGNAFRDCRGLRSVVLSDGLVSLGANAFSSCGKLVSVTPFLPETLTNLGARAFQACTSLEGGLRLVNPALERLEPEAFRHCDSLRSADLSGVAEIGAYAFGECLALAEVVFSDDLRSIGPEAFRPLRGQNSSLTTLSPVHAIPFGVHSFRREPPVFGLPSRGQADDNRPETSRATSREGER